MSPKKVLEESQQNLWGPGATAIWEGTYTQSTLGVQEHPSMLFPTEGPRKTACLCVP